LAVSEAAMIAFNKRPNLLDWIRDDSIPKKRRENPLLQHRLKKTSRRSLLRVDLLDLFP